MASATPAMTRATRVPVASRFSTVEIRASSVSIPLAGTDTRRPSRCTTVPGPDARGNVQGDAPRVAIHRGAETRLSRAGRNVVGVAGEHGRAEIDCDVLGDCGPGNDRERQPPHRLGMSGPDDGRRRARHTERRLRPGCRTPVKNGHRQQDARPSLNRGHWCVLGRRHPAVRGGIPYRRAVAPPRSRGGIGRGCPCSGGVPPPIPRRRRSRPAGSPIETVRTV